jgi:hypothetical protein
MSETYVVTGTLTNGRTVALDETLPLEEAKVRVTVEPLAPRRRAHREVVTEIRRRQAARGHRPRSREEIDAQVAEERASWDA